MCWDRGTAPSIALHLELCHQHDCVPSQHTSFQHCRAARVLPCSVCLTVREQCLPVACPLVGWSRAQGGGGTAGFGWLWPHACCNPTSPSAAKRAVISAKTVIRLLGTNLSQKAKQEGRTSDQPFYMKPHRGKWRLGEDWPCQVFLCCVPVPCDFSASLSGAGCCSASQVGCASPSQWGWSCSLSHLRCCAWVALCPQSAFPHSDKMLFIHCCVLTMV